MLTSRHFEAETATLACPRCGSDSVVPARSGDASEYVFQLRDGRAPAARADAFDEWLCLSCGLRWPHETPDTRSTAEPGVASDVAIPDDLLAMVHVPEVRGGGVTSPRVAHELRTAREARGLSVSDAANATRIWERYLSALEANAPMEEFPAPAYARFFLRGYAEFLGIDPDTIVHEFDEDHPVPEEPVLRTVPYERPRRRGIAGALVFLSIVALVALGVVRLQQGRENEPVAPAAAPATGHEGSQATPSEAQPSPAAPKPIDHIRAVLRVNVRSWVEVYGDGQTLEAGVVLEAGQHMAYRAERRLEIRLGNAGGVDLQVGGEAVPTSGTVVTMVFKLRDGEIVTRTP